MTQILLAGILIAATVAVFMEPWLIRWALYAVVMIGIIARVRKSPKRKGWAPEPPPLGRDI